MICTMHTHTNKLVWKLERNNEFTCFEFWHRIQCYHIKSHWDRNVRTSSSSTCRSVRERERKRTTMCSVHHTQHAIESAIQITGSSSLIRKRVIEGETWKNGFAPKFWWVCQSNVCTNHHGVKLFQMCAFFPARVTHTRVWYTIVHSAH